MRFTLRRLSTILQTTTSDCGPACLAMVAGAFGCRVSLRSVRADLEPGRDGVPAKDLRDAARRYGLRCRAWRLDADAVARTPTPFIAHWEGNHYVVARRVTARFADITDPAIGRRRLARPQFDAAFTGIALTFEADAEPVAPIADRAPSVWRSTVLPVLASHRRLLAVVLTVSAALAGVGLVLPAVMSRVVSSIGGRHQALPSLWALAALAVVTAVLALLRGVAIATLQTRIGRRLSGDAVANLLRGQYRFFEQRGTGDIVSRLGSTDTVRDVLAAQLVTAVLDGVLAVGYLAVITASDRLLGLTCLAAAAVELGPVGWLNAVAARRRREELVLQARAQSSLVEAVSGIATVKAAGVEQLMLDRWQRLHTPQLAAARARARISAVSEAIATGCRLVAPIALLVVASARVDAGVLAAGAALGLAALGSAALGPIAAVGGHLRTLQETTMLLAHVNDVLETPAEQATAGLPAPTLRGRVDVAGVGFRFDRRGPWVLRDVNLSVPAGAKVAIVGESGSGKSTLAALLVGLYQPGEGAIRFDGLDLAHLDLHTVRRQVGVVLQEPFLFAGTIRDNIALARRDAPLQAVRHAAYLAAVDADIDALPLGYETTISDGGHGLSGGQRQRLSLARALLAQPRILVLDEATSHLDVRTEALLESRLEGLQLTRIVVAHRLSTVRDADLVVVLHRGRVVEYGSPAALLAAGGAYARMSAASGNESAEFDSAPPVTAALV